MEYDIAVGDVVKFLTNGIEILILVASIKKADTVFLPPNSTLGNASVFLPDPSPNALSEILLCGQMFVNDDHRDVSTSSFKPPEICINYNDIVGVIEMGDQKK